MKIAKGKEKRQSAGPKTKRKKTPRVDQESVQSLRITERLNEIYSKESSVIDPAFYFAQIQSLKRDSW